MRIKRLELKVEYEEHSMHVFHSPLPNFIQDPPTIIVIDGKEYAGYVSFKQEGDAFEIKITPATEADPPWK